VSNRKAEGSGKSLVFRSKSHRLKRQSPEGEVGGQTLENSVHNAIGEEGICA
jgi:hypothetical protein